MNKKNVKTLLAIMVCAVFAASSVTSTVCAANNPNLCPHDGYYIVDNYWDYYSDEGDYHIYHYGAEILCMECFGNALIMEDTALPHDYENGICVYCGHDSNG